MDNAEAKLVLFWVLGGLALALGTWLMGHYSYSMAHVFVGFLLVLFAGLSWIGVGVGVVHYTSPSRERRVHAQSQRREKV